MQTILSSFDLDTHRRSIDLELAHADDRLLLDVGLVRAADGTLRLVEDPSQPVGLVTPRRRFSAFLEGLGGLWRWFRSLPLRSPGWHPHPFLRE
jgi:hypothetical protein